MRNQKKIGVFLSYLNIVLGTITNIVLTPILIIELSNDSYSIYKVMHSFAGPVLMLNLGFATIVARATARYQKNIQENSREKENVFATSIAFSVILACLAVLVGFLLTSQVPRIYGRNYSPEQTRMAQEILMIFVLSAACHILADPFKGSILGNEHFAAYYGLVTVQHIAKLCLTLIFLRCGASASGVALVDLLNNVFVFSASAFYSIWILKEKPRFHYFDKRELYSIFTFGFAVFLQTVINQINNSMDLLILGAYNIEARIITLYSAALTIYSVYNSILSVFVSIFFPQITRMLSKAHTSDQLTALVIKPGRIQAAIAVAVMSAFALFGKDFICLWIGESYIEAYYIALMLMIPVTIPLVQNACISILDAKLKRLFRSCVLFVMALINFVVSIILVKKMGYIGATLGTVLSLIIGHVIIMNIYYSRVLKIRVFRMFAGIFRRILPIGIITSGICLPLAMHAKRSITWFIFECIVFVSVYIVLLWKYGFTEEDKKFIIDEKIDEVRT